MPRLDVRGTIVRNDSKWLYKWFGFDATCPRDVETAIKEANGETLDVYVSSPGGEIASGSEIYSLLTGYGNVKIHILGEACSAASVIAMAGWSEMAPTALMMVHCVSTYGSGNHNDFEHTAEVLRAADEAMGTAYERKSGMSREEVSEMMNHETWLTAELAVEMGLVDQVMFNADVAGDQTIDMVAGSGVINQATVDKFNAFKNDSRFDELSKLMGLKDPDVLTAPLFTGADAVTATIVPNDNDNIVPAADESELKKQLEIAQAKLNLLKLTGRSMRP